MRLKPTPREKAFARALIVDDMNASDAYRHAYSTKNMTKRVIHTKACLLRQRDKVQIIIKKLQNLSKKAFVITIEKKKEMLIDVYDASMSKYKTANGRRRENLTAATGAIAELNRMDGDHAPVKQAFTDNKGKDRLMEVVFINPEKKENR